MTFTIESMFWLLLVIGVFTILALFCIFSELTEITRAINRIGVQRFKIDPADFIVKHVHETKAERKWREERILMSTSYVSPTENHIKEM